MRESRSVLSGLRFKLAVSILIAVLVSVSVLSFLLVTMIRNELQEQMIGRAAQLGRSVERVLELSRGALPRQGGAGLPDESIVRRSLMLFAGEEYLTGLALLDDEGTVLARQGAFFQVPAGGWKHSATGYLNQVVREERAGLLVKVPLRGAGRPFTVAVLLSLEKVSRLIAKAQARAMLIVGVSGAVIYVMLFLILTHMVVRPLGKLNQGIRRVSEGKLDHRVDLMVGDELGLLAQAFNDMAAALGNNKETIDRQIEDLKQAHRATLEAQEKLIAAEKLASLGTLAAGVAHEVGNPLGAVIGYVDLLKKGELPPDEARECLERTSSEVNRIHRIMLELLNYARPSREESSPVDVNAIIRNLVSGLEREGGLAHLKVKLELAADLPHPRGYPHKLEQVFVNLVDNAVAATRPEGRLTVSTGLGAEGKLIVRFADTGKGVPEEHRDRVFDPFFTTRTEQGGTGLGLSISRRIIEEMGGSIGLEDREEGKTSFVIRLPVY